MLTIKTARLDLRAVRDYAEHYAGRAACDLLVIENRTDERITLMDGRPLLGAEYAFIWTGRSLRRANDLEAAAITRRAKRTN